MITQNVTGIGLCKKKAPPWEGEGLRIGHFVIVQFVIALSLLFRLYVTCFSS